MAPSTPITYSRAPRFCAESGFARGRGGSTRQALAQHGIEQLPGELERQLLLFGGRAPVYQRLLRVLLEILAADDPASVAARDRLAEAWARRAFSAPYDRPLLLLAALRADARAEGEGHPLYRAIGAAPFAPEAVTRGAVIAALGSGQVRLFQMLRTRAVQTNEPSRAVAWRWPAALCGAGDGGRPLALADLGASAGLNLVADALPSPWRDPGGSPLPVASAGSALVRLGLDAHPLDVARSEDAAWLAACIWPGEPERLARLEQATAAFLAARLRPGGPVLEQLDATAWPARLDALAGSLPPGTLLLAYQTIVRDYLGAGAAAHAAAMRALLQRRPPGSLLWVELETGEPAEVAFPAAITAHVRAAGGEVHELVLARTGYHPEVVAPDAAAVAELQRLLGA